MDDRPPGRSAASGLVALGIAALAIACCAGPPLLLALAASVGVGTVLGIGGGIVAAALLVGAVGVWAARQRAACETPRHQDDTGAASDRSRAPEVKR